MPTFEIQGPDGRSFEIEGPDATGAANAFRAYNDVGSLFSGGKAPAAAPAPPPAQPYSLGPVSDLTELGARGINAGVQGIGKATGIDVGPPRVPKPLGAPINLPGIGQPSAIGMGQGLYESAKSGASLPGDVYAGRVDPLSDQGIGRAAELASLTPLAAMPSVVSRAPGAAMAAPEIKTAAKTAMDAIRDESRAVPIQSDALEAFAKNIRDHVSANGPSEKNARGAYAAIDDIAKPSRPVEATSAAELPASGKMTAKEYQDYIRAQAEPKGKVKGDLGDLIDSREALMTVVREGKGKDKMAAQMAVAKIDSTLESVNPNLVARIKDADKNYAIAEAVRKQERGIQTAIEEAGNAGTGGNVGNKIRQAVEKDLKRGMQKGYLTPEVQSAMENVTKPGAAVNALRPMAAFDPTHSKLGAMFGWGMGLANPMNWPTMAGGYAARASYDRIMQQRAAMISEAMRAQAPAAIANPGAPGGIVAGRPAPAIPQRGIFTGRPVPALAQPGILNLGVMPPRDQY